MRLPLAFLFGGLLLKTIMVLAWRSFQPPKLANFLLIYDPGAFAFAERGTALFFDQRRIAPSPGEAVVFEALLVIGFGIECFLLGLLIQWFRQRYQGPSAGNVLPGSQTIYTEQPPQLKRNRDN